MRIDVHAHYLSNDYLDLLDRMGGIEPGTDTGRGVTWPNRTSDLDARFHVMQQAGVDLQILSVSGLAPYFEDAGKAAGGARYANDEYAELLRAHPGKFSAFACLPLPHIDESIAELTRALDDLGMAGVTMTTSVLGRHLGDPLFDPLYAELDRRGTILFIHPAGLACGSAPIKAAGLLWPLGGTAEDTLCAVHMMQSGFTVKFPNIRTILPHLGGTLPFLMHRLDRPIRKSLPGGAPLKEVARKFWYDTVNGEPAALRLAVELLGIDRMVFGTDYPFFRDDAYKAATEYVIGSGLSDADVAAIFETNPKRLLDGIIRL